MWKYLPRQGSGLMLSTWRSPTDLAAEQGAQERIQGENSYRLYCLVWGDSLGSGRDLLT